jgi:menaquinone-specific isochorismate synthase
MTTTLPHFIATTVALNDPPDLLAEAGPDGYLWRDEHGGIAGQGVAFRLPLPGGLADLGSVRAVGEQLSGLAVDDQVGLPGCGPVAIGALPFDRGAPASLVVPQRLVGRAGDKGWVTTVRAVERSGGAAGAGVAAGAAAGPGESPDYFSMSSPLSHREWKAVVARAVAVLDAGELEKVVLARRIDINANRDFVIPEVLERLVALYPSCMVFHVDGFLGASPELLINRTGDRVESHPLAGTVARSGDAHTDEALVAGLMASRKTRHEHAVVIKAVADTLGAVCDDLTVPDQPSVLGLRNVSHLATRLTGRLAAVGGTRPSALELVARLHPTPAVGGTPTTEAVRYMEAVEGFDRGRYAGPVGWVDARGDGAWAIGIRCAEVDGPRARIYAGNGIVTGSDPADELAETQLKLQALLAALVRP